MTSQRWVIGLAKGDGVGVGVRVPGGVTAER